MKKVCLWILMFAGADCGRAVAGTINFEQYANGTVITNQYSGVVFAGAEEQTSAGVVQQLIYTPHSGTGFLSNVGTSVLTASFATPQSTVSGFYTAYLGMTITAYGANGSVLTTEVLAANLGSNTSWAVSMPGITSLSFRGAAGTIALDDFTYTTPRAAVTPEPASLLLLGTGLCAGSAFCVYQAAREKRSAFAMAKVISISGA